MSAPLLYHSPAPFALDLGGTLPGVDIAYHTYGTLSEARDNVVWVCHALTANSDVADWWPHTVVPGGFLDPSRWYVVCANIIGSCYGSTGPMSVNPATRQPWYGDFPRLTMADIARAHALLADALGIGRIAALVGSSVGGFQAVEWAVADPARFGRLVLIATGASASPWTVAIDETQRMAIKADSTWGEPRPDAARDGLAAARAIGLLTYRGPEGYNATQRDPDGLPAGALRRPVTYQRHQGDKLVARFDAYSYVAILDAFDTHDVGRGRGGRSAALARLGMPVCVIGLSTDIIFTPAEMRALADALPHAEYHEIASPLGHDGFLVEHGRLNSIINRFFNLTSPAGANDRQ
ncbi:MAG: homoserine O-acetyltransferase [Bacteroidales bacterium]|nr:homoserine O-acetyltransferase [Bacteroidales bacterium]